MSKSKSSTSRPETREPDVSVTAGPTADAMATVRWSMRVVREARDRAEKRVEGLVRELAAAKQKVSESAAREQKLRKTLDGLRGENAQAASDLTRIKSENGQMRLRMKDLSSRSEILVTKLNKTRSDADRERQTVEDKLSQKCRHLRNELEAAVETIDNLKAQLAIKQGLHDDLKFSLDTSRKTHTELKQMISELLGSAQSTVTEIEEALLTSPAPTT